MTSITPLTAEALAPLGLPSADRGGDKDERGRVLVVAGAVQMPGAALLASTGALRVGAGKVRIATCARHTTALGLSLPEAYVIGLPETPDGGMAPEAASLILPSAAGADAILIGPGMVDDAAVAALTRKLMQHAKSLSWVLDAAAMKTLRESRQLADDNAGRIIVTPHSGEMAEMMNAPRAGIEADPVGSARALAAELGIVVVLKGARTFIVTPQGHAWRFEPDAIGLGTAGSGDTLSGLIVGLLARGATPIAAACGGVYLHGEAGKRLAQKHGPLGYLAHELLDEVPAALARCCE